MPPLNQPLLINVLGHAGGALIFAIFLYLLFSGRGWSGVQGRGLPALAAVLSLVWNLGSLAVLVRPGLPPLLLNLVIAVSFSVLSLLPAVLLHLSVGGAQPALVGCGYSLSAVAVAMHFWEIRGNGPALHQAALLLITAGFLLLTGIAVAIAIFRGGPRHRLGSARIAASMCLALFAMSFVHFGAGHAGQAWSSELIVHHAGIPLALFVLLQDYRFVLLDAFVRFLANALLAAVLTWLVIEAAFRLVLVERTVREPLPEAALLISVCLFLVFFAWLRNQVQTWLTRAVFRQGSVASLPARLRDCPVFAAEELYLDWAASTIAAAVRSKAFAVISQAEVDSDSTLHAPMLTTGLPSLGATRRWDWAEAVMPVRLSQGNSKLILLGRRQGGQRYLGEDLDALAQAAAEIADKVEALRQQEMNRLVSQAELRALQSQINPHFLFNALNTLYGTIPRESPARRMVLNLAEIFRYFLQSDKTFVTLAEEMQIVRAYLEVEQSRLGDRLAVETQVDDRALPVAIPALSIQPLVENAIKHGVAKQTGPGYVRIQAALESEELHITVENSADDGPATTPGIGVGLENVRRRLEICYGPAADLRLAFHAQTTVAELCIPMAGVPTAG
ncbi:MAG TPA: histidine kinase [Bryobacteraceae bacterium]|nr:histidine kinase [Bryobacteraceae bacterium]